jgi:DNA-binding NarL/FixJ family response regulator
MRGLGVAIQKQFTAWQLTRAEAEIGLFLLKGLSHREIAQLRQTSERTIREQARSLYRKAGIAGRAELSAFFLEELLLPLE